MNISLLRKDPKRVYFIGIGGSGMSGLATLLAHWKWEVRGSDPGIYPSVRIRLEKIGILVFDDVLPQRLLESDVVVYTQAIPEDHPELLFAREKELAVFSYPEMVGKLTEEMKTFCVAGTHGKTTTTSMLSLALLQAGCDPTVLIGAEVPELDCNSARSGNGDFFVVESCEYKNAFHHYQPEYLILTNIDYDHIDFFPTFDSYLHSFQQLIKKVPATGKIIAWGDNDSIRKLLVGKENVFFVGYGEDVDYQIRDEDVFFEENLLFSLRLGLPGKHNLLNATFVVAMCHQLGINLQVLTSMLLHFRGAGRRFELKKALGDTVFIDDYAHHPTEIKATLQAARSKYGAKAKILAVFQPHQYSRTKFFLHDFAPAFQEATEVLIPDIFQARDTAEDMENFNGQVFVELLQKEGVMARFGDGLQNTAQFLRENYTNFDVILVMGAGNIGKIFNLI